MKELLSLIVSAIDREKGWIVTAINDHWPGELKLMVHHGEENRVGKYLVTIQEVEPPPKAGTEEY